MNSSPFENRAPFKHLKKSEIVGGTFFDIKEVEDDPTLLVKEETTGYYGEPKVFEGAVGAQKVISEYLVPRNIAPRQQFVQGENEKGEKIMYVISERIQGKDLTEDVLPVIEHLDELEKFLKSLLQSSFDASRKNVYFFIRDIRLGNVMWGRNLRNDCGETFYFVDPWPGICLFSQEDPLAKEKFLFGLTEEKVFIITFLERLANKVIEKFSQGSSQDREKMISIIERIDATRKYLERMIDDFVKETKKDTK